MSKRGIFVQNENLVRSDSVSDDGFDVDVGVGGERDGRELVDVGDGV